MPVRSILLVPVCLAILALAAGHALAQRAGSARPLRAVGSDKINLNTCTLEELQNLPGVGPAMGAHIMAGRPYESLDDLARDGVPLSTIEQIRSLVILGPLVPAASPWPGKRPGDEPPPKTANPIDLNTASAAQLQRVLGVRPEMAHWIIAGRPYRTLDDLSDAGIPQNTVDAILMLIMADQATLTPVPVVRPQTDGLPKPAN